jgi:FAD/FMN-containing dehydrogenase
MRSAPDELTSNVVFANPFLGGPAAPIQVHVAYDGDDPHLAEKAIDPVRALGTVLNDDVALKPYGDTLEDGLLPPGIQVLARNGFVNSGSVPQVLETLERVGSADGSPIIALRSVGAAVSRVPTGATAYAHRDAELMVLTTFVGPPQAIDAAWPALEQIWVDLESQVDGACANFLSTATAEDVSAIYPPATYARLAAIKRRYDPGNVFAGNHNVLPE